MIAENSNQTAICSPPKKRSLFNKPSWSRPQALSSDTDLFHRSNQTYADLAAEAERARKRKLARKERERARQYAVGERAGKRRRVSEGEDNEDDDSSSDESADHSSPREIKTSSPQSKKERILPSRNPQKPIHSPKSLLKRYEAKIAAIKVGQEQKPKPEPESKTSYIIDLEDEEASALPGQQPIWNSVAVEPAAPVTEDNEPVSDDEFPELARQAREKARRKRLEEDIASRTASPQDGQISLHGAMPSTSQSDPVLHILVTSSIDNTVPLIISRRLSQRLKDVRLTWTKRQNFPSEFTDTVFLTWRGKRVFDVTTCRSLGISVDAIERVSTKGDSLEEEGAQIHMEAMTARILEAYKKAKCKENAGHEDVVAQEEAVPAQDNESQFRIILKAKGLADFKLQVRPSTLVSKIVNAFRYEYQVSGEKDVFLSFDGERLSPDIKIEETELSDMDTLDCWIRP